VRHHVESSVRHQSGSERIVRVTHFDELDLLDSSIRVAPLPVDQRDTCFRLKVDDRVRAAGQQLRRAGNARGPVGARGRGRAREHLSRLDLHD
jgi:hypothetical protein